MLNPINSILQEHSGNCGHEPVYCENKCGAKVQRRHTQQHVQQHCSKRLVPCRHCGQRYTQVTYPKLPAALQNSLQRLP